jgi:N-acyl-D-amino-acid deacylase
MHRLLTAIVLLPVLASSPSRLSAQPAALLIRGGQLVDGTGTPARAADVRISGDTIVEVGEHLTPRPGERVIDAADRVLSPGFIDMHSHAAGGLDDHPDAASQIHQGITTALMGQDGSGDLPVSDFLEHMETLHPAINVLTSVGHGTVRGLVMGGDYKRAATLSEIDAMKVIVERGMKDGAVGFSSGIEYDPGFYATTDELVALASVIKPYGGFYSSHVRDDENEVLAAWSEAIEIGRRAGVPVEISHMKLASAPVWGQAAKGLALVDAARRAGQDVTGDWYPYPYWHSSIYVLIPDRDFDNLAKWQRGLDEVGGPANVLISSYKPDPSWIGRTLADLAAERHIDAPHLVVQMIKDAGTSIGVIVTAMDERDMTAILAHPATLICSDGELEGRHPRGYGTFPACSPATSAARVSMEDAIAKMTSRSALKLGLRRAIAQGRRRTWLSSIRDDRRSRLPPAAQSRPDHYVIVGGEVVLDHGRALLALARPRPETYIDADHRAFDHFH